MYLKALAASFDNTLAVDGRVEEETIHALTRLHAMHYKLILITWRLMEDLLDLFPGIQQFDLAVVENGALLYFPEERRIKRLADPLPKSLVEALTERSVQPLGIGRVIITSQDSQETLIREVLENQGSNQAMINDSGNLLVLPEATNRGSGLQAAAEQLHLDLSEIAGIGNGEIDRSFLEMCGYSAAVANAKPEMKKRVDWVTQGETGAGVRELAERLLNS